MGPGAALFFSLALFILLLASAPLFPAKLRSSIPSGGVPNFSTTPGRSAGVATLRIFG